MHIELAQKREALKSADEAELVAQEIVQRGAINACETLLKRGVTRANVRVMLLSLRENLAYIEEVRRSQRREADAEEYVPADIINGDKTLATHCETSLCTECEMSREDRMKRITQSIADYRECHAIRASKGQRPE